jgi:Fe2+ transport system protein FeoA
VVRKVISAQPGSNMNVPSGLDPECPTLCPLNLIQAGMPVRIKQLRVPGEMLPRLREMGFCEEQIIKPIVSQANIICQVCNARLAISAQLAQMIMVEPVLQVA